MTNLLTCGMMHRMISVTHKIPWKMACLILTLGLLAFRFLHLPSAPFINDEPRLLNLVDATFLQGIWPSLGPVGSQPIPYGPIPHWFYQVIRHLSGHLMAAHWAHALVFCFAHLAIFAAVFFTLGARTALLFLCLAASSPWLFVYSQMPWEVLLLVSGSALVVLAFWLLSRTEHSRGAVVVGGILWGAGIAICLGTHLMAMSLVAASAVVLAHSFFQRGWKSGRNWAFVGLGLFTCSCILFPYASALFANAELIRPAPGERWGSPLHFWWSLIKTPMHLSPWQIKYFLEPQGKDFFAQAGWLMGKIYYLDVAGWAAKLVVWAAAITLMFRFFRKKEQSEILLFSVSGIVAHVLLLQYQNIATYPHYFLAFWWAPFLLLANFGHKKPIAALIGVLVCGNVIFLAQFNQYLAERKGTQGWYYGTFVSEQKRLFNDLCANLEVESALDLSEVKMTKHTAEYFLRRLPACAGKKVFVSVSPLEGPRVVLLYPPSGSAELKWEKKL